MTLPQLRRLRHAVRAALALALAVSLAANVLHASDDAVSRCIAAWPPIALMLSAELISRVPASSKLMSVSRIAATLVIAGIAAWISYWHMTAVAGGHGEDNHGSKYMWALTVDGLAVVASICLVEIGRLITAHTAEPEPVGVSRSAEPEPVSRELVFMEREPEPEPVDCEPYVLGEPEPVEPVSPGVGPVEPDPRIEPFDVSQWDARLREPLGHPDPWLKAEPVKPEPEPVKSEPVVRKLRELRSEPVKADPDPVPGGGLRSEPVVREEALRQLTELKAQRPYGSVSELVRLAHIAEPDATNERLSELSGVSLASVKRHRPPRDDGQS